MTAVGDHSHEIKRCFLLERKAFFNKQHIKKQRHYFVNKGSSSQSYGFSSRHIWMWEWDYKESWALKNECFRTVVLEKTLESSLDCREIQPVNPKGNQFWIFIAWTDGWSWNSNTLATWWKELTHCKGPDAGKDRWEEKGQQRMRWLDGITDSMEMSLNNSGGWWWPGKPGML